MIENTTTIISPRCAGAERLESSKRFVQISSLTYPSPSFTLSKAFFKASRISRFVRG
jgi:hypothetical protein